MIRLATDPDCTVAGRWARLYLMRGLAPLPSREDRKQPALRAYRHFRDGTAKVPEEWCDRWWAPNVQVALGLRWRLCVVDLDGPGSVAAWNRWCREHGRPAPTWTVRTGGGNWQLWFRHPEGCEGFRRRLLWAEWDREAGRWAKHRAVELLGDGSLIVAPPSVHPETGRPYTWAPGRCPLTLPGPAELPGWVLSLPEPRRPARPPIRPAGATPPSDARLAGGAGCGRRAGLLGREAVAAAISEADALWLARSWGLRVESDVPNDRGFLRCRSVLREDRHPSAGWNLPGRFYAEPGMGPGGNALVLSLFDLGALIGGYPSWWACKNELGRRLGLGGDPSRVRHMEAPGCARANPGGRELKRREDRREDPESNPREKTQPYAAGSLNSRVGAHPHA